MTLWKFAPSDSFDHIFTVGRTAFCGSRLTAVEFTIDVAPRVTWTEAMVTGVGMQSLSIGPAPGGGRRSVTDLPLMANEVLSTMPVPATAWLMVAGFGGLVAVRQTA